MDTVHTFIGHQVKILYEDADQLTVMYTTI